MKKPLLLFAIAVISLQSFSQQTTPSTEKENYMVKSKNERATAWILLGGGAASAIVGSIVVTKNVKNDLGGTLTGEHTEGAVLILLGGAAAIASIPFFISSNTNKKRASLAFSNQPVPKLSNGNMIYFKIPSLKLSIVIP